MHLQKSRLQSAINRKEEEEEEALRSEARDVGRGARAPSETGAAGGGSFLLEINRTNPGDRWKEQQQQPQENTAHLTRLA